MNVRLTPAVKCIFDEEELSLRVILAEIIEREDVPVEQWAHEVVVYALKVCIASLPLFGTTDTSGLKARKVLFETRLPRICRIAAS